MQHFIAKLLVGLLYALIFTAIGWLIGQIFNISAPLNLIIINAFGILGFILGYLHFKKALNLLGEFVAEGVSQGLFHLIIRGFGALIAGIFSNL